MIEVTPHFANVITDKDYDTLLMIGGYGSGKSFTGFVDMLSEATMNKRKVLVVRKVGATILESCFADCLESIELLECPEEWSSTVSPMKLKNNRNGSVVIFKGLDKASKIKSIKDIDYIVVEEADELSLDEIKELKKRLRTKNKKLYFVMLCNPTSKSSSVYKMFFSKHGYNFNEFDLYKKRILKNKFVEKLESGREVSHTVKIHHSTYRDNLHLPDSFIFELESEKDQRIKDIARDGKFGSLGDRVLNNLHFEKHVFERYVHGRVPDREYYNGLDFGCSISFNCGVKMAVNPLLNELYIYMGYYQKDKLIKHLAVELEFLKSGARFTTGDSANAQQLKDLSAEGYRMYGVDKSKIPFEIREDRLNSFARVVVDYERCPNSREELAELEYKEKKGEKIAGEYNIDSHYMDAISYGMSTRPYTPLKKRVKEYL